MRHMRRFTPALVLGMTALLATPFAAQAAPGNGGSHSNAHTDSFGTKAVYQPEQNSRSYQRVPAGFTLSSPRTCPGTGPGPRPTVRTAT